MGADCIDMSTVYITCILFNSCANSESRTIRIPDPKCDITENRNLVKTSTCAISSVCSLYHTSIGVN